MKKLLLFLFSNLLTISLFAQTTTSTDSTAKPEIVKPNYAAFWISGAGGAGATVSSNIVNTGAVLPFRTEFLWQSRTRRMGFGFAKELFLTPEALGRFAMGQSPGISKFYFVYEKFIFRHSPINLGFSSNLGFFSTGDSLNNDYNTEKKSRGGMFGNVGCVVEMGVRPVYFFVRPDIEFQSWSGFHKQIQATATVGLRLKFLSKAEKNYREAKKMQRKERRKERRDD